jgi:RNA polymerase sigma-70 factor (ECF subfamily)
MAEERVEGDVERLVALARAGDQAAFGELVRIHQHEVFTLAVRLVGDRSLAADVTQEALVRAWKAIGRFRGDAAFSTWLHRITVNAAWTQRTRAKRHQTQDIDSMTQHPEADLRSSPELAGERAELRSVLGGALNRLPDQQRAVVVLKDIYGWSHKDIAESLSISVTAAKVRLHRAHLRLRDLLKEAS